MEVDILEPIKTLPLLSKKEVYALIKSYQDNGCLKSRNKIIDHNMRMVYKLSLKVLKNYSVKNLEIDDLVSEGVTGIIKAIDKFDLSLNYAFSTYAYFWIQEKIQRSVLNNDNLIRIPVHSNEAIRDANREAVDGKVKEYNSLAKSALNAKTKVGSVDDEDVSEQLVCYQQTAEEAFTINQTSAILETILKENLSDNEILTIRYRYGIGGHDKQTLDGLAALVGLSRERIRQIETSAIKKLRDYILKNSLEFDYALKAS